MTTNVSFNSLPAVTVLNADDQTLIIQVGVGKRATVQNIIDAVIVAIAAATPTNSFLLEDGSAFLLEDGTSFLLES